jgi:hypothetical protein
LRALRDMGVTPEDALRTARTLGLDDVVMSIEKVIGKVGRTPRSPT